MSDERDDLGTIWPGSTWTGAFTWVDDEDAPISLVGYTATLRIGKAGEGALVELTGGAGLTLGGSDGTVAVVVSAAQSATLAGYGLLAVDLDVAAGGVVTPIVRAELAVGQRVEPGA